MQFSFLSLITERPRFGNPIFNLAAFSDTADILEVHADLVAAADIIQSRFPYMEFLVEACPRLTRAQVEAIDNAFEISVDSNLFLLPFEQRVRLPDADYTLTNFLTYARVFDVLKGELEVDIDGLWEELYAQEGLICFRLILPN